MDIASLSTSLKQFFEITEHSAISKDPAFKAPEENSQPNEKLVAEFERYMQETASEEAIQIAQNSQIELSETQQIEQTEQIQQFEHIEQIEHIENIENIKNPLADIKTFDTAGNNGFTINPSEESTIAKGQNFADSLSVEPQEYLQEIQKIFNQIENNELSTNGLFRLQYLTSMLNVQITQNNSMSKSSTEQFETILKQQG